MAYADRREIYKRIEDYRGRPLIAFITSLRVNATGQIASDAVAEFIRQIVAIPKDQAEIDIMIISNGGDPLVPWRIMTLLRERFSRISVLVPYVAYSAATLFAMGANEIVMHPFSNLGPIDPQLTRIRQDGQGEALVFGSEDVRNFLDFVREDVGISDQKQLGQAFELLCKEIGAVPLGVAKRSAELSLSLGEQLLKLHMDDSAQARTITSALNRSNHHGFTLGRAQAKTIGLPIKDADETLEELLWAVWQRIETDMQCNRPFNPLETVLSDPQTSALLAPVPQFQVPSNLPPELMNQVINSVLQQAQVINVPPVDYDLFIATIESVRLSSEFRTRGKISAVRLPDLNIALNMIKTGEGWAVIQS